MANPTNAAELVQVNIRTSDGAFSGTLPTLPAKGQTTFLIKDVFPETANTSGLAEFYVTSGSISIIALRANGIAFTAAPVYSQTGDPIIGAPRHYADLHRSDPGDPAGRRRPRLGDHDCPYQHHDRRPAGDLEFQPGRPERAAGVTTPWSPPFQTSVSSTFTIPAGSSIFLRTPGDATALSQGWAELTADPRVVGYAIFTELSAKGLKQDSTAPAVLASSRILVPFDNTPGLIMALALVNPNASAETVSVNFRTSDGTTTTATAPNLPPQGQITFLMPSQFPDTATKSGLAEFYVSSGTISIIALRANGTAITSARYFRDRGAHHYDRRWWRRWWRRRNR